MFVQQKKLLDVQICACRCMIAKSCKQEIKQKPLTFIYQSIYRNTFSVFQRQTLHSTINQGINKKPIHLNISFYKRLIVPTRPMFTQLHLFKSNDGKDVDSNADTAEKGRNKWLTIPNSLTFFRMGVSPYIGHLVLTEQFSWALGLVFFAGLTDYLDGWIARNIRGQTSIIGSYIDPLADKILISILTLSLTGVHIIPIPLCVMIIARDILLVATSSHFHYKYLEPPKTCKKFFDFENSKVKMEPTLISKYNTFLQLGLVWLSVAAPVFNFMDHSLLHAYWYLVASTTVLSGLSYVIKDKSAYKIKK